MKASFWVTASSGSSSSAAIANRRSATSVAEDQPRALDHPGAVRGFDLLQGVDHAEDRLLDRRNVGGRDRLERHRLHRRWRTRCPRCWRPRSSPATTSRGVALLAALRALHDRRPPWFALRRGRLKSLARGQVLKWETRHSRSRSAEIPPKASRRIR